MINSYNPIDSSQFQSRALNKFYNNFMWFYFPVFRQLRYSDIAKSMSILLLEVFLA